MTSAFNTNHSKRKGNDRVVAAVIKKAELELNDPESQKIVQNNKEIADIISNVRQKKNTRRNLSLPSYEEIKTQQKQKPQVLASPINGDVLNKYPTSVQNSSRNFDNNSYRRIVNNFPNSLQNSHTNSKKSLFEQERTEGDQLDRTDNTIESIMIAKSKLERDKLIVSNSIGQMRDISYLYESIQKAQTTKASGTQKLPPPKFFAKKAQGESLYSPETLHANNSAHLMIPRSSNNSLHTPNSFNPEISPIKAYHHTTAQELSDVILNNSSSGKKTNQVIQNFNINMNTINNYSSADINNQSVCPPLSSGFNIIGDFVQPKDYIIPNSTKQKSGEHFAPQIWTSSPYKNINSAEKKKMFEEDELLISLQKEVPGLFSHAPASRYDIIALRNWMNQQIKKLDDDQILENREKIIKCDEIYNLGLNEVLRQISIEFSERAEIFYSIWGSYVNIFEKFKIQMQDELEKARETYEENNQRSFDEVCLKLVSSETQLSQYVTENDKLKSQIEALSKKIDELSHKESNHKEKLSHCKKAIKKQKEIIHILREENKFYSLRNNFRMVLAKKHDKNVSGIPASQLANRNLYKQKSMNSITSIDAAISSRKLHSERVEEESSESNSENSSIDIIYENDGENANQVIKVDQLNNFVSYKSEYKTYTNLIANSSYAQTDITLMKHEFEEMFSKQSILNDFITDLKIKKEIDILEKSESENLASSVKKAVGQLLLHPSSFAQKSIYQDKLDGMKGGLLNNSSNNNSQMNTSSSSSATKIDLSNIGEMQAEDDKPKIQIEMRSTGTTPKAVLTRKRSSILIIPETVREEDEEDKLSHIEKKSTTSVQRLEGPSNLNDSKSSTFSSKRNSTIEEPMLTKEDEELENGSLEGGMQNDKESKKSLITIGSEIRLETFGMSITDDIIDDPAHDQNKEIWSEEHSESRSSGTVTPVPQAEPENKKISSLGSLVSIKKKVKKMINQLRAPEEGNLVEKAKILQYIRLYKVEAEKNKILSDNIIALEDHLLNDKETISKLEENILELRQQIQIGIALTGVCSHGKCPECEAQKRASPSIQDEIEEGSSIDDDTIDEGNLSKETGEKSPMRKSKSKTGRLTPEMFRKSKDAQNPAPALIAKLKAKKFGKFKNFMPAKMILKQIQALYYERVTKTREFPNTKEEEFCCFTYNYFLNNFGFKKLAEQKFVIFILSLKKYLHVIRINLFARFLGLLNGAGNYNLDEFNKYIEALDFITNNTLGIAIINNESDPKHFTPFIRCLDYIKIFSENKLNQQEFMDFKKELEILKQPDPKKMNRLGIIDIDLFMTRVLLKYRLICNRTKKHVISAFRAADLDGNKYCSYKEFDTIYKYIEAEKYDRNFVSNLFYEHADSKVEQENNLTFDKFTIVCVEYTLFTDLQQDNFLGISKQEEIPKMLEEIKFGWVMKSIMLSEAINASKTISEEDKEFWSQILKVLGEKINQAEALTIEDSKPLLIAYKMLSKEIDMIKDLEAERDAYGIKIEDKDENDTVL